MNADAPIAIDQAHLVRVFQAQRANRTVLKRRTADQRRAALHRLRAEIVRRATDIDAALHEDMRRPIGGAANMEVGAVLADIDTAVAELAAWMADEPVTPSPHFSANRTYIRYEPRGVVLLLGPWNFPFALVFAPLVPIIAAGNACIVKPNELQPRVAQVICEIIAAAFPEDEVAAVQGGIAVAEALQDLPFDHVFFTGSPAIGKKVMAAAARHLASVTLELGGKCPAILDDTWDIGDAAAKIVAARMTNAGQFCLAVDHVWVPRERVAAMTQAAGAAIDAMFYADGVLQTDRLPRMVDTRNFARVASCIDDAIDRGGRIAHGGMLDAADLTIHPTVMAGVPLESRMMTEEIFGPVLPILGYDSLAEVAEQIDRTGKPLAVYVFSQNQDFVAEVLAQTSSGGVTVNHVLMHAIESRLPFGGVNGSGMGRYKGVFGFRELSNARSVFVQT
jgi:aldehyde dehydrogenase (NAD+)